MGHMLKCISPIDGSVFAQREALSFDAATQATKRARAAQPSWAARPLQERIDLVMAGVAAVGEMNDEIVPELSQMMGRPVRYGGEFSGFEERARHMASIARQALPDIAAREDNAYKRYIKRLPQALVLVVSPYNYPSITTT